jgi:uncharacterized protein (TIGR03066 family)
MAVLRLGLVVGLLLTVVSVGLAEKEKAKIDKAKLIGTWTFVKTDAKEAPPGTLKIEFTKDGKVNINHKVEDKTHKIVGTWSLKEDQLTTVLKIGKKDVKETITIKELTAKKLVTVEKKDDKVETTEFKK